VDADLEAPRGRGASAGLELVEREQEQAGVGRVVAVRCVERGAAGTERAIRHELHGSDGHPSVAESSGALVERRLPGGSVGAPEGDVIPEGERAGRGEAPVGGEGLEVGTHLVDSCEADGKTVGHGGADGVIHPRRARARLDPPDELLSRVDQDARWLTPCVALQPAAGRVRRVPVDAGCPERRRVHPGRVTVDADQGHGMTRHRPVERRSRREALARPAILIPSPSRDPLAGRSGRGAPGGPLGAGRLGRESGDIERQAMPGQVHEVAVRVDEPRQHGPSAEVDLALPARDIDVSAAAGEDDASGLHDQGIDDAVVRAERVDAPVGEDHRRAHRAIVTRSGWATQALDWTP
jgi:hypothetical protein